MPSQKYEFSRRYIKMGWSVIPIRKGTKYPAIEWNTYRNRFATENELDAWFNKQNYDIAIVTGALSKLSVIDIDAKEYIHNYNSKIKVITPHGKHLYFKYQEGLRNYVKIEKNIDIRSEGAFVLAPCTIGYTFVNPYFLLSNLPEFPIHLIPKEKTENSIKKPEGWIADALRGLREGNRDSTFTSVIGRLNRDGYDADTINVLLSPYAKDCHFDELEQKIEHILNDYPHYSRDVDNDESDSLSDFLRDSSPISWICEPIIARGTIGFVAGLPKTMKTWICADLAIEVARGGNWLGRFPVNQGRVLFIDQERWKGEVQRRFKMLMNEKGLKSKDLEGELILKSQTSTRLDLEESFNAFRKRLTDIRPALLIVDSFATWHTKQENNRQDIQIVLERIKQLRTEFKCTILIIDHEGKQVLNPEDKGVEPNPFTMVGSVGKSAAAETVLTVRKEGDGVTIYHTASNLGPTVEPIKVSIRDINIGTENGVLIS